jgi:hypothetical protein
MKAGGAVVEASLPARAVRSTRRRQAEVECGDGGRERREVGLERPAVPERSTFRRVAVFVPFR